MPKFFRVETRDRPDLALLGSTSQLDLMGYAFPKLFPLLPVTEKGGTMTVAPVGLTASKGTKGRSNGSTLSPTDIQMVDVSYSTSRYEGRGRLYENDGAAYADAATADAAGGELAQRLAWNKVEDDAFATIFTTARINAAAELSDHRVIRVLQSKAKSLRRYGKPYLVMTTDTWLDFCEIPEIRRRLENIAGANGDIGYIMQDVEKVKGAINVFLRFEGVVLFDSEIVESAGSHDGEIAVVALRPEAWTQPLNTLKSKATYGFAPVYIPDGADTDKPFDMRTWYDNDAKANVYDSEAYLGIVQVYSAAVAMTKMADAYTEYAVPVVNVEVQGDSSGSGDGGDTE